jgi:DNA-binding helix-hairpin-helix protein with protein kinase domain
MSTAALLVNGQPLALGKRIGKGGEGEVYVHATAHDVAIKLYTLKDVKEREAKIDVMIKNNLAEKTKLVSFPKQVVRCKDGKFAGFVMQRVVDHKPLFELYSPGTRKQNFPRADYRFLVRAASNIASIVAQIHKTGCVIGDINHSGILVSRAALAAFIDADSFQIKDGEHNHPCVVGVPEYTPPELQGQSLSGVLRTIDHDAFGLAVVMFQLLFMGRHPFIGTHEKGDMALDKAIKEHRFAYSLNRDVGMVPPPGASTLRDVPKSLSVLFERAFAPDRKSPRPTALEWMQALQRAETDLVECKVNQLHHHFKNAPHCPWCHMEQELKLALFLPNLQQVMRFQTGTFNVDQFWKEVSDIKVPPPQSYVPVVPNKTYKPSWRARQFKFRKKLLQPLLALLLAVNGGTYWFDPMLLLLSMLLSTLTIFILLREKTSAFSDAYQRANAALQDAVRRWKTAVPFAAYRQSRQNLETTYAEFMQLKTTVEQRIKEAHSNKHHPQINDHLSQFSIGTAKLKGLGEAKVQLLASYGIDTAASVIEKHIRAIPGFGQANTQVLLEWRKDLEKNYHYVPKPGAIDMQAIRRIHSDVQVNSQLLQKQLQEQRTQVEAAAKAISNYRTALDPEIAKAHVARKQAIEDLKYLSLQVSTH